MPLPTINDVHVDALLSNMSIAYIQDEKNFVSHRTFASVPVKKASDRYTKFPKGYFFRSDAQVRADNTESAAKKFSVDTTPTYFCLPYALHHDISDRRRKNADSPMMVDQGAVKVLTQDLMLRREIVFATKFLTASSGWSTVRTGGSNFTRWDQASSTPIDNMSVWLDDAGESTGWRPNVAVFGPRVWTVLKNHAQVLDRLKYTSSEAVTEQIIARLIGVDEVLVARATRNSANEGAADSMSYLVGDVALFAYRTSTPMLDTPAAGYVVEFSEFDGVKPGQAAIGQFRMEHLKADRYEGQMDFDMIQSAPDAAVFADDILT